MAVPDGLLLGDDVKAQVKVVVDGFVADAVEESLRAVLQAVLRAVNSDLAASGGHSVLNAYFGGKANALGHALNGHVAGDSGVIGLLNGSFDGGYAHDFEG